MERTYYERVAEIYRGTKTQKVSLGDALFAIECAIAGYEGKIRANEEMIIDYVNTGNLERAKVLQDRLDIYKEVVADLNGLQTELRNKSK